MEIRVKILVAIKPSLGRNRKLRKKNLDPDYREGRLESYKVKTVTTLKARKPEKFRTRSRNAELIWKPRDQDYF